MGCSQSKLSSPLSERAEEQIPCDSATTTAAQAAASTAPSTTSYARQDSAALLPVLPSTPSSRTSPGVFSPRGGGGGGADDIDEAPSPRLAAVAVGTVLLSPRAAAPPPPAPPQAVAPPKKRTLPTPFSAKGWLATPSSAPFTLGSAGPRRPATNPTPTSHHDVLLNFGSPLTQSQGVGGVAAMSSTTEGDGGGMVGGSGISARGGRRPRPLAIPTDSHFHLSTILGHLVIGGDEVSDNLTVLRQLNVKCVVNTTTEGEGTLGDLCYLNWSDDIIQPILPDLPRAFATIDLAKKEGGLRLSLTPLSLPPSLPPPDLCYLKLNWSDDITQPILPDLPRAFAAIDLAKEEGGICLVHCKKGMSRSGAVVVAYLMYSNSKMSLFEALTYARSRRAIIAPNLGFMAQLVEWEKEHRGGRVTVDLAKYEENRFGDTAVLLCGA